MKQDNSSSIVTHQDSHIPLFYLSKQDSLDKRIQIIVNQLKMPLNYIYPADFQQRVEQARQAEYIDSIWVQNYKDIIAHRIQGKINTHLIILAQNLRHQFSGSTIFWLDLICSFAQDEKYEENLRIWEVKELYKNFLHLQKGEYEKTKKFRKLAKTDIQINRKLINQINEAKKYLTESGQAQEDPVKKKLLEGIQDKIRDTFQAHEQSTRKISDFLRKQDRHINLEFFTADQPIYYDLKTQNLDSNSNGNSKTKRTQRDKYPNQLKQKMVTDFSSIDVRENKNKLLLKRITGSVDQQEKLDPERMSRLNKLLGNMGQNSQNLSDMRMRLSEQRPKVANKPQAYYCNISIEYMLFSYNNFHIPQLKSSNVRLYKPEQFYDDINYQNNDQEEYVQLLAEDLDQFTHDSEDDQEDSLDSTEQRDLVDEYDPYFQDPLEREMQNRAIRVGRVFEGKQWVFDFRSEPKLFLTGKDGNTCFESNEIDHFVNETSMIFNFPLPMRVAQPDQGQLDEAAFQKLKEIIQGRTNKQIFEIIEASESLSQEFPKQTVRAFLANHTKKVRRRLPNGKKVNLYVIKNKNDQNSKETKENLSVNDSLTQNGQASEITSCNDRSQDSGQKEYFPYRGYSNTLSQKLKSQMSKSESVTMSNRQKSRKAQLSQKSQTDSRNSRPSAKTTTMQLRQRKSSRPLIDPLESDPTDCQI